MEDTSDHIEEKYRDFHGAVLILLALVGGLALSIVAVAAVWIAGLQR
jgi:hypothetical protein